jgi:hypothetical protein
VNVRLTQLDGKLPNLALMRLAAFHRGRGDDVRYTRSPYRHLDEPAYDRVYGSAIFSFSAERVDRLQASFPGALVGGTWNLPPHGVEPITLERFDHSIPDALDYSDHPTFGASIGFTQRGCRLKCKFCVVPRMEGKPRSVGSIPDIWRGAGHPKHLHLLDNDFFGQPREEWRARLREIRDGGFKVCFSQGFNIRLINAEGAAEIASVDYRDDSFKRKRLYTAWDNLGEERRFFEGVDILAAAGIPPSHLLVYMLVGFDPAETWGRVLYRFQRMADLGIRPYPMIFEAQKDRGLPLGNAHPRIVERRLSLRHFQRWAIRASKLGVPFHEYEAGAKGWSGEQTDLFAEVAAQ